VGQLPRGTVTLVFTDVQGSTELLRRLGRDRYRDALNAHRRILHDVFGNRGGVSVETQGDSHFYAFSYARQAVMAAAEVQRALAEHAWPHEPITIRVGIHTGEPEINEPDGDGYTGLDVHRAARVMSVGHGGQILLSARTTDLVEGELPEGIDLAPLGRYRLKDFDRPEHIAQVTGAGLRSDFPPLTATRATPEEEAPKPTSHGARRPLRHRRRVLALTIGAVVVAAGAATALALRGTASGPTSNAVLAIDPARNAVVARVSVGNAPTAVAVGAGAVWVVNSRDGTLSEVSPDGHVVRTVGTTGVPADVTTDAGQVWVAARPNVVLELDPATAAITHRLTLRSAPTRFGPFMWLAARPGEVLVTALDRLSIIDARTRRVHNVGLPTPDWGALAADAHSVWMTSNSELFHLSADGTHVRGSLATPQAPVTLGAGFVWALNPVTNVVAQIDPVTNGIVRTTPVGADPADVAYGAGSVWVASQDGTVTRVDPRGGGVQATIHVGGTPESIAVGLGRVWVTVA
jgi:class 3 adenylate cyclase